MGPFDVAETYRRLHQPGAPGDQTLLDAEAMCNDMIDAFRAVRQSRLLLYDTDDMLYQEEPSPEPVAMEPW